MEPKKSLLDDPRPDGREPIPSSFVPELVEVFASVEGVLAVIAFTVHAEGVMQSDATFGVWVREDWDHAEKVDTLREIANRVAPLVEPQYYLDLMLLSPRDDQIWAMALEYGDAVYMSDKQEIDQQFAIASQLGLIDENERDIDVLRVL